MAQSIGCISHPSWYLEVVRNSVEVVDRKIDYLFSFSNSVYFLMEVSTICSESNAETDLFTETEQIKKELLNLAEDLYIASRKHKFLMHRIADIQYELKHTDEKQ